VGGGDDGNDDLSGNRMIITLCMETIRMMDREEVSQ
jgi:hypothetical protein